MDDNSNFLSRIIPATRILQTLTGRGFVKDKNIKDAEKIIDSRKENYGEYTNDFFKEHLKEIKKYLVQIENKQEDEHTINAISSSIANFRANISMVDNVDYVDICSTVLKWIESIEVLDDDAFDILSGYHISMEKIFSTEDVKNKKINHIIFEMDKACQRYFDKHAELVVTKNMKNTKSLYISEAKFGFDIDEDNADVNNNLLNEE